MVKLVVEALALKVLVPVPRNSTSGRVAELVRVPEMVWGEEEAKYNLLLLVVPIVPAFE